MKKIIQYKSFFKKKNFIWVVALFLFVCLSSSSINVYGSPTEIELKKTLQQTTISLNIQNKPIKYILGEIYKQVKINFIFKNEKESEELMNMSIHVKNASVQDVLNTLLNGTNFTYELKDDFVTISKKRQTSAVKSSITGVVIAKNGRKPIIGAAIIVQGTTTGAISDEKGNFSIFTTKGVNVEVSCVGYKTKVVSLSADKIVVELEDSAMEMDDVVVTGIYTRKAESFTGSSSTFKSEQLKQIGGQNVLQSLKTLDPSFNIMESREYGSDPNTMPDIEIRGKSSVIGLKEQYGTDPNQPLFILDGFETSLKAVIDLNMDRVASVTILKDAASTAIYGSKAANGVVVIETKSPEAGKFRVTYSGNIYVSMPDLSDYNLMNSSEKLQFELEAGRYKADKGGAAEQFFLDGLYNMNRAEVSRGVDTYWMNEPLRTAITHKHNLYAEGGDHVVRYGVGVNYNNTAGVMKKSGNDLIGIYFDLSYRKGIFLLSNKMSYEYYNQEDPTVGFSEYSKSNPYYRKNNPDGGVDRYLANYLSYDMQTQYTVENPLYNTTLNSFIESKKSTFEDKINLELRFLSSLILRGRFGLGTTMGKSDRFTSPLDPSYDRTKYDAKGSYNSGTAQDFYYDGDITLSYGKLINEKHQLNAVIGARMRASENSSENNTSIGYPVGDFSRPSFATGFGQTAKPLYSRSEARSNSVYFNGGYTYKNRYLFDANFRLDGSSIFGSNKKHSETWAVGLAWNIHYEKFMSSVKAIDRFKIRASIGNPGNQNFNAYQSFTTYRFNNEVRNAFGASMLIDKYGNPDLKWQKTLDKNIGFDLTMLKSRLNVTFDYYNKVTDPLLASISVPSSVGVKSIFTNMGEQHNKGYSGTIKVSPILRPQDRINWTLSFNFRHQTATYQNIGNSLDQFNKENINNSLVRGIMTEEILHPYGQFARRESIRRMATRYFLKKMARTPICTM